jgi:hypothetical protein
MTFGPLEAAIGRKRLTKAEIRFNVKRKLPHPTGTE